MARQLLNDSIRRLRYRPELSEAQWRASLADYDIFLCKWQGVPLVVHAILRDKPGRALGPTLSGSVDRTEDRFRGAVGPANRLLHWEELRHYKQAGYHYYDFGGCTMDPASPEYPISQFKLSFGSEVVMEPTLYLARNPALRLTLRCIDTARKSLKQLPWPKSWVQRMRTSSRLASLFR